MKQKPKELDWVEDLIKMGWKVLYFKIKGDNLDVLGNNGNKIIKYISKTLTKQRKELLEEYFEKEDNLIDKYANLKDDNWDKFLEARSKLKINFLNKKDENR